MGANDQFYRTLAKSLIEEYGPLMQVEFISHYKKFEINFHFKKGTIYSGEHTGQIDISRLALGYYGTGPCYAQVFLESAGFHLSMEEIEKLNPGAIIELRDSKPVISYPNNPELDQAYDLDENTKKLFLAIKEGNISTFKSLIDQGEVDLEGLHYYDFQIESISALGFAVSVGNKDFVNYLIDTGVDVDLKGTSYGHATALHEAVVVDNIEIAKFLIESGASLDIGHSPIEKAVSQGKLSFLDLFVGLGIDINKRDSNGNALMHYVDENNNPIKIIQWLLDRGANLNVRDDYEQTPLHLATRYERDEVAKALLDRGANLNVQDDFGFTPLHYAARNCNYEIVKVLLELGADANIKDNKNKKPFRYATDSELIKLLKSYTASWYMRNKRKV